jgi:PIN domain nuclease of toxin-antitoxin system
MTDIIADSSAVLAFISGEPGGDQFHHWASPRVCAVNHAEIVGRLIDWGLDNVSVGLALRRAAYAVDPFSQRRAEAAARLGRDPRTRRLSLGDRACIALALEARLPVLTADRAWSALDLGIDVRLIR